MTDVSQLTSVESIVAAYPQLTKLAANLLDVVTKNKLVCPICCRPHEPLQARYMPPPAAETEVQFFLRLQRELPFTAARCFACGQRYFDHVTRTGSIDPIDPPWDVPHEVLVKLTNLVLSAGSLTGDSDPLEVVSTSEGAVNEQR